MPIKPAACGNLLRVTFCFCQCLKDAQLRGYHNGTCERHGYDGIPERSRHNSCPERNSLQEVLRTSIQSHNSISSYLLTGIDVSFSSIKYTSMASMRESTEACNSFSTFLWKPFR